MGVMSRHRRPCDGPRRGVLVGIACVPHMRVRAMQVTACSRRLTVCLVRPVVLGFVEAGVVHQVGERLTLPGHLVAAVVAHCG